MEYRKCAGSGRERSGAGPRKAGAAASSFYDKEYPELLKEIYDPPIVLYVKGKLPKPGYAGVGIVGSREASINGLRMARTARGRSGVRWSGRGERNVALGGRRSGSTRARWAAGGSTLAILGGGLISYIRPEHKKMAQSIEKNGALISEYPMD